MLLGWSLILSFATPLLFILPTWELRVRSPLLPRHANTGEETKVHQSNRKRQLAHAITARQLLKGDLAKEGIDVPSPEIVLEPIGWHENGGGERIGLRLPGVRGVRRRICAKVH